MNPKNSQDLFNKIRSQFSNIRLGDENGAATADPTGAVFFEFEFKEDAEGWCKFQNKNCTFGTFDFPKFLRPFDE